MFIKVVVLSVLALKLLSGCGNQTEPDAADFGAASAAKLLVNATRQCRMAGFENLGSCMEQGKEAATAAKMAFERQRLYSIDCPPVMGRARCDDMMESAYAAASGK